ncbi:MAG: PEP/pyruvate-binding domain-containing protein [Candidatus Levybacteria bacterium]|nr:PEP/pyruvate-binding domain-containing protein [Candidatus Levybacteria bacterium]
MDGAKAESLKLLRNSGFLVPQFIICSTSLDKKEILEKIDKEFAGVRYFAVRSSAQGEDSEKKSFAGHFYSGIGIKKKDVYQEFIKVRKSFGDIQGAVIIQEFIPSEHAGVAFTKAYGDKLLINSTIGLCKPVVEGEKCDEYICTDTAKVIVKTIQKSKRTLLFVKGSIEHRRVDGESLSPSSVKRIIAVSLRIEKLFIRPQDIEWCIFKGKIYILQSRPITRKILSDRLEYFDSANIAESYSGIVLPLTFSFAQMVYARVYQDLLANSGASREKIKKHKEIFENLLGLFYGRMFYNMNNWYLMAAFLPGYKRNKENFELMITSNVKQDVATDIKPSFILVLIYPLIVFGKLLLFSLSSTIFKYRVKEEIKILRKYNFDKLDYVRCIQLFNKINNKLLKRWFIPLENDFLVMTYLGLLKKLAGEKLLQKLILFESRSTTQADEIARVSKLMQGKPLLWSAILSNNVNKFHKELDKNEDIKIVLDNYLNAYGGRFANELKLESIGIDEDISKFFSVLIAYKNFNRKKINRRFSLHMPLSKKILLKFILPQFKRYASQREEFRLLRSNTFGLSRKLFRRMGKILVEKKVIRNVDDVFYLEVNELLDKSLVSNKVIYSSLIKRKTEYRSFIDINPPAHFTAYSKVPFFDNESKNFHGKLRGRPSSEGIVKGRVKIFKEFFMPIAIDFEIMVAPHTDPGWTSLIALSKGMIIEYGGVLSHASIVARELGIPTVIGVQNATDQLKDGQIVEINGSTGEIKLFG